MRSSKQNPQSITWSEWRFRAFMVSKATRNSERLSALRLATTPLEPEANRIQQILGAKRLGQELDGPTFIALIYWVLWLWSAP